jgi:hypothetical protein
VRRGFFILLAAQRVHFVRRAAGQVGVAFWIAPFTEPLAVDAGGFFLHLT